MYEPIKTERTLEPDLLSKLNQLTILPIETRPQSHSFRDYHLKAFLEKYLKIKEKGTSMPLAEHRADLNIANSGIKRDSEAFSGY